MGQTDIFEGSADIAIVGMAGRFPGAQSVEEFWRNLRDGVESISFFGDEQLLASGVAPAALNDARYVKAKGVVEGIDLFDASFFGFNPREAEIMDPQHRVFLECAWEALEHAGYTAETSRGRVGVYAGLGLNTYLLSNLYSNRRLIESVSGHQSMLGNDKDFLSTRVSYKLNLKGPSVSVQTACSTSLVAVHLACQSLLNGECGMALAGGITLLVPQKVGYRFEEGSILSPDGHCRAFDAGARGTVSASGAGVVVLKRLEDALADGDHIHAVIKGSAVNNDGSVKVGYTAPSVEGQAAVIGEALSMAGLEAEDISYVEAHGTGTVMGDPIEIAALTQAFRATSQAKRFCAVGSVKTNIGHLDTAAGVAGLIKTVLALENRSIPPSLHFVEGNPEIDFENSPFYVNAALSAWETDGRPRRAGVSSFGIGGTNAHVVVEEAPPPAPADAAPPYHLLVLSARTRSALDSALVNLQTHLQKHPELNPADVAYTLQVGRKQFDHRAALVCRDLGEALKALETRDTRRLHTSAAESGERPVVFMFPGQGSQYVRMAAGLYEGEPAFREQVDFCSEQLLPRLGCDLRRLLYPADGQEAEAAARLDETFITQPALFAVEYALARTLMRYGVRPRAMIGHSIGEYVAACLAGVFSPEDALRLVAARGRLMQELPRGALLSVSLPEGEVEPLLTGGLSLAAVNGHSFCVVSGETEAVSRLELQLAGRGLNCRRLRASHAFHSQMMEPILARFAEECGTVRLSAPQIPYVSNLSGSWATAEEVTDVNYWTRHLRQTVRFAAGMQELLKIDDAVLLEVGPGQALSSLTRHHPAKAAGQLVLACLPGAQDERPAPEVLLEAVGKLWVAGGRVDWDGLHAGRRRRRVPLPAYPFERSRHWIEPRPEADDAGASAHTPDLHKRTDIGTWFYTPLWKQSVAPPLSQAGGADGEGLSWLVLLDECGIGRLIVARLEEEGREVTAVTAGEHFSVRGPASFTINPRRPGDYQLLLEELAAAGRLPQRIVHLFSVTPEGKSESESSAESQQLGFYSLLHLAQALGGQKLAPPARLFALSNDMQSVTGEPGLCPEKATLLGACKVIPQEYPNLACRSIDLVLPQPATRRESNLVEQLLAEMQAEAEEAAVAYRHNARWTQVLEPVRLEHPAGTPARLREQGVYLITGGLGGMALEIAEYLSRLVRARLVLVGRSEFPARGEWQQWLEAHDETNEVARKIRKLQSVEERGGEVLILRADVTDRGQMSEALSQARARFGRVNGVIHAAGVAGGGLIQFKTVEAAADVLAPKVRGLRVLEDVLDGDDLDFLLLFSSINSILGGVGQADYAAANLFLDAFARYDVARRGRATISVNWDAWQEVGMAAQRADASRLNPARPSSPVPEARHPLLGRRVESTPRRETFSREFSVAGDWILDEHRIGGHALLPGTAFLEIGRAVSVEHPRDAVVELCDVFFLNILRLGDDERRETQTVVEESGGGFKFTVRSADGANGQARWQEHAIGRLEYTAAPPQRRDLAEILSRCPKEINLAEEPLKGEGLGPRWDSLRAVHMGDGELLAVLELPEEFADDLEKYKLHPALLDVAAGAAKQYLGGGGSYLPLSYKRVRVHEPLRGRLYCHARSKGGNRLQDEVLTFDLVLMDERGAELVEVEEFSAKRIGDSARMTMLSAQAEQAGAAHVAAAPAPRGRAEEPPAGRNLLQADAARFILTEEGLEVFGRVLTAHTLSQVIVSTADIHAVIEQANASTPSGLLEQAGLLPPPAPPPTHPRPEMQTPYLAPRSEVERTLASIWQELLGIAEVGVADNFFELGGDSVVAIHVIARASQKGLQLSPQLLFNHPTIEGLAAAAVQPTTAAAERTQDVDDYTPGNFELVTLDESKLSQLSRLLGDTDDDEESDTSDEPDEEHTTHDPTVPTRFSLFYFAADNTQSGADKYRLYIEGAKFADRHGFEAVWTPERHFHEAGGLYPNPSVLSAALATITERIQLRAGSVVLPLHHSLRVAEEWSVIDNLSRGRVGLSFTSGWIPNDFAFFPERFTHKRDEMWRGMEEVRRLWRGQSVTGRDGAGKTVELKILPRPVQPELPIWLTCSSDPEMFIKAGEGGFNVLTALLAQSVEEVGGKVALYREARARAGHDPATGLVTLMMHTFVGEDEQGVLKKVRAPLGAYLKSHVGLMETMTQSLGIDVGIDKDKYLDTLVEFAFERYYQTASLIGTPEKCLPMVERLRQIGVNEVACLIDFGVDVDSVLESLRHLNTLRQLSAV